MRAGLIGMPGAGKTSVFNAITRSEAPVHSYDAHDDRVFTAVVPVPDPRLDHMGRVCGVKKVVHASLEVVDGAARIERHEHGSKFGTDFFAGVRSVDALVLVLRGFQNPVVSDQEPDPVGEAHTVESELILADLMVLEGRLERLRKSRTSRQGAAASAAEEEAVRSLAERLESSRPLRQFELSHDEQRYCRAFGLVSALPLILVLNIAEEEIGSENGRRATVGAFAAQQGVPLLTMCARLEAEAAALDADEEREFLQAMGIEEPARDTLIRVCYEHLGLISFLTIGSDEVRAWSVRRGTTALGAAERVHTDLARGFVRAEVMEYSDFERYGGWDAARAAGKMRVEGREYVVKDGDIIHIRASRV